MRYIILLTSRDALYGYPDIVAKSLVAALLVSNDVRRDTTFTILLEDRAIHFMGRGIRQLRADERSAFGIVEKALRSRKRSPHPGVAVEPVQDQAKYVRGFPKPRLLASSPSSILAVPTPPFTLVVPWKSQARVPVDGITGALKYPHHTIVIAQWLADVVSEGRKPW